MPTFGKTLGVLMIDPIAFSIGILRSGARAGRRRELRPHEVRSVGVIELTRMGDVLSALPSVRGFQQRLSHARLHMFVAARWAPLLGKFLPGVTVHGLDASESIPGLMRASRLVRELKLDLCLSLSPANRNALLCLSSGSPMKAGYLRHASTLTPFLGEYSVEGFGLQLRRARSYSRENIYRRAAMVFEALGLEGADGDLPRPVFAGAEPRPVGKPYVVLHPFSGWEWRNWPLESYAALADGIVAELGLGVMLVHAPEDRARAGSLLERFNQDGRVRVFSSGDLLQLAAVVKQAEAFVGNDSGPLHLAAALGVPLVGLYGAAPPELTAPPVRRGRTLYGKVDCSPCDQRFCRMPERNCMARVPVREVLEALEAVLKRCETPADG
jgi:ADP-heptose:LPS heptosyltransferase